MDQKPMRPELFQILLSLEEEHRHGYGILKRVEKQTAGAMRLAPSLLYRRIKRLMEEGLVEEVAGSKVARGSDDRRRYYRLSTAGLTALRTEAARIVSLADAPRIRDLAAAAGKR